MNIDSAELVRHVSMQRIGRKTSERRIDSVAVEEPLAIRLQYWFKGKQQTDSLALTMRTPGNDRELAAGFLFSEGVITAPCDLAEIRALGGPNGNELLVSVHSDVDVETWRMSRSTFVNSSCGICGKRSIDVLENCLPSPSQTGPTFDAALLRRLPQLLGSAQAGFAETGGLHAAARIDEHGRLCELFEDIGRHNALDKLIGASFLEGRLPLSRDILFLSSRSSFELVQKAAAAGAPVLATVGSPTSLAIETARRCGLTLAGFVRDERFNLYSGEWRIHS